METAERAQFPNIKHSLAHSLGLVPYAYGFAIPIPTTRIVRCGDVASTVTAALAQHSSI